jgi:hypothetical protein
MINSIHSFIKIVNYHIDLNGQQKNVAYSQNITSSVLTTNIHKDPDRVIKLAGRESLIYRSP